MVTSEPGTSAAAAARNAAELGSAGTTTSRPCKLRIARDGDARLAVDRLAPAPRRRSSAACARCDRASPRVSMTVVSPAVSRPASRTALFTCADGTGSAYSMGTRLAEPRTMSGSRSRPPSTSRPICCSGPSTRPIGPAAERSVAVDLHRHVVAGDDAEHQPRAGTGVAEVERAVRLAQPADAAAGDAPLVADLLDRRAERLQRLGGVEHVLGLEQAREARDAGRQRAEHQGAVRDRFVARDTDAALEWAGGTGGQGPEGGSGCRTTRGRCSSAGDARRHRGAARFASDRADASPPCQRRRCSKGGRPELCFDKPLGMWQIAKKSPSPPKVGSWRPIKTAGPSAPARTASAALAFMTSIAARSCARSAAAKYTIAHSTTAAAAVAAARTAQGEARGIRRAGRRRPRPRPRRRSPTSRRTTPR